jgi:transposase
MRSPKTREEQPDDKVLRWTGTFTAQSAFVIEDEGGKVIARGEVPTTPDGFSRLQATYHLAPGTQVALETRTVAFFVARQLSRLGLDPAVVDAHEVRLKAHRPNQKSDGRDALPPV